MFKGISPLSSPVNGEQYIAVLQERQATWMANNPSQPGFPPLLEWFIADCDELWVQLPDEPTTPKKVRKPRVYRSAESLRAELVKVNEEMDRVAGLGVSDDNAIVNLSPNSRSRTVRSAGRRRFAVMDRNLERYTQLRRRRDALVSQLARQEARETK